MTDTGGVVFSSLSPQAPAEASACPIAGAAAHPLALPRHHLVAEFRVEACLGVGGFGITYLAFDGNLERRVALKEYMPAGLVASRDPVTQHPRFRGPAEQAEFQSFLQRFREEALHIARFNHKNIVPIHRVLMENQTAYIVMEYLGGVSLGRLIAAGKRLTEPELAHVLGGLLEGAGALHAARMLHRDIKPSNVMLRGDGTSVLIDFGSARRAHLDGEAASIRVVSAGFSPPEQYDDRGEIGPWSDIFGLAATCYFAMRAEPPASVVERALALMQGRPDPIVALSPETTGGLYSDAFLDAISHGLELQVRARPQSIAAWAAQFPPPLSHRQFAAPNSPPFAPDISFSSAAAGASFGAADESPATLIASTVPPSLNIPQRGTAIAAFERPRSRRMVVLASMLALGIVVLGATLAVVFRGAIFAPGASTSEPGPPAAAEAAAEPKVSPLAAPAPEGNADARRCDELVAHPDDPGKPPSVNGVEFGAITEAAALEAVEVCGVALRREPENFRAQFNMARALQRTGTIRIQNREEAWRRAREAYAAAARSGYAAAQGNFGQMLYLGSGGMVQNQGQAIEWLRKAAEGDFPDAYMTLAHAYATGSGVGASDARKAYCWLTLLERSSSIREYRAFAQQQRATMLIAAADKKIIDEGAWRGLDCF